MFTPRCRKIYKFPIYVYTYIDMYMYILYVLLIFVYLYMCMYVFAFNIGRGLKLKIQKSYSQWNQYTRYTTFIKEGQTVNRKLKKISLKNGT